MGFTDLRKKKRTPLRRVFDPACRFQGVSFNSLLHKGPCLIGNLLGVLLRFFLRASCLRGRYFEHVLINLPTIGRHSHPLVPLEESGLNNATNEPRHPESHPRRQAFSRNGKLCNAVNHERQRSRQYKCGEDS